MVIEEGVDFINKFYKVTYTIDNPDEISKKFLKANENFYGSKNTKYNIVSKLEGNYLVLYKSTTKEENIPFTQRTSMKTTVNTGNTDNTTYMVPWIGYPIKYCKAELIENSLREKTYENQAICEDTRSNETDYIRVNFGGKSAFSYKEKKDLFPITYFTDDEDEDNDYNNWYLTQEVIESSYDAVYELPLGNVGLIKFNKKSDSLEFINNSGDITNKLSKDLLLHLPLSWKKYKLDKNDEMFSSFTESEATDDDDTTRPYIQINFTDIPHSLVPGKSIELESSEATKLVVGRDYLSVVHEGITKKQKKPIRIKTTLLRKQFVDSRNFKPRRWFEKDHNNLVGLIVILPPKEFTIEDQNQDTLYDHARVVKFNVALNTKEEIRTNTKTIKWYFSNTSTHDSKYTDIVKEGIDIFNQTFEIAGENSTRKIKLELVEDTRKEVGDLRYNIINILKNTGGTGVLGVVPQRANTETGQVIGSTNNVLIDPIEDSFFRKVRNYIRYEVFQKQYQTEDEQKVHVVSHFIRSQIKTKCPEVIEKIENLKKTVQGKLPNVSLNDSDVLKSCSITLAKPVILKVFLHEMGHNFSLAHNPECSIDKDNFYSSYAEIKEFFPKANLEYLLPEDPKNHINTVPQAACVMDYDQDDYAQMPVLGKYDIATLRLVYFDQLELADGTIHPLNTPDKPSDQVSLSQGITNKDGELVVLKTYRYCSSMTLTANGWATVPNNPPCAFHDHGASPKQVVENTILSGKRLIKNTTYRYDLNQNIYIDKINGNPKMYFWSLARVFLYYQKWLSLEKQSLDHIKTKKPHLLLYTLPAINDTPPARNRESYPNLLPDNYKTFLERHSTTQNNPEFSAYYPIRELYATLMKEFNFEEEMKCIVKDEDKKEHKLNLDFIKNNIPEIGSQNLTVVNCYSKQIETYLTENDLTLTGQSGYVIGSSSISPSFGSYQENKPATITDFFFLSQRHIMSFIKPNRGITDYLLAPDFLKELDLYIKDRILDQTKNITPADSLKNLLTWTIVNDYINTSYDNIGQAGSEEHNEHFHDRAEKSYPLDSSSESFYKQVEEPLKNGLSIESFNIPFLKDKYKDYKESTEKISFQQFLTDQKDLLIIKSDVDQLIIPYTSNSFMHKVIDKFFAVEKRIETLEKQKELNLIEWSEKETLENYKQNTLRVLLK